MLLSVTLKVLIVGHQIKIIRILVQNQAYFASLSIVDALVQILIVMASIENAAFLRRYFVVLIIYIFVFNEQFLHYRHLPQDPCDVFFSLSEHCVTNIHRYVELTGVLFVKKYHSLRTLVLEESANVMLVEGH